MVDKLIVRTARLFGHHFPDLQYWTISPVDHETMLYKIYLVYKFRDSTVTTYTMDVNTMTRKTMVAWDNGVFITV